MQIAVIGMNQNSADISIRNRVAYLESDKIDFTTELLDMGVNEVVILATCGRNEIYMCDYKETIQDKIKQVIEAYGQFFSFPEVKDHLYTKVGREAILHLYQVAAGLDSIVLGEDQILGQVKEAHSLAMELGASKKILNRLFRDTITTSKQIKTDLRISEHPMSISYIGVKFLLEKMGTFDDKNILIIGTGEMGQLALEYVFEYHPGHVYMTNRNHKKVLNLKDKYPQIKEVVYTDRNQIFPHVDAVITATASPHCVISKADLEGHQKEIFLLDLAMPRDVDENVLELEGVHLFNVDSLNKISKANEAKRQALSEEMNKIIQLKLEEFSLWMVSTKVDPAIRSLNKFREQVQADTLEYIHRRFDFDSKSKVILDKMITSALKRMVRQPIISLKEIECEDKMNHYLEVLNDLYNFEGE